MENTNTAADPSYSEFVSALAKNGREILDALTPEDCHSLHMAVGISSDSGELLDAVKRAVIYRKPIDIKNVIEEMGDIEFFMEGLRQSFGITREQVIAANVEKLRVRYSAGCYSDKAAIDRADKAA